MRNAKISTSILMHCKQAVRSLILLLIFVILSGDLAPAQSHAQIFDAVCQHVDAHFFDKNFNGVDWQALKTRYRPKVTQAASIEHAASLINEMLGQLRTSHTRFYTEWDVGYYALLDIFSRGALADSIRARFADGVQYTGIGLLTRKMDHRHYVSGVLAGTPADSAGLQVGDALLAADGQPFHPIRSFRGKIGRQVTLRIQTTPLAGSATTVSVPPVAIRPGEMMLAAMRNSIRLIEREGQKIGYVRIWSYAGQQYQQALVEAVAFGALREADALIVDLRDGWGGANPNYLNLFNKNVPQLTMIDREGKKTSFDFQWRKPVALLVNEGTRSGKETLAYGFKKYGIGKVIGTRTAGAVTGGRLFWLPGGHLLYLAVQDVLVDGERLEGVGVAPDLEAPFALPFAQGRDPQLERAVAELLQAGR